MYTNAEDTSRTVEKINVLKRFDPSIAAVIDYITHEQCLFCVCQFHCTSQRKRAVLEKAEQQFSVSEICDDYRLDPTIYRRFLLRAKKELPDFKESVINRPTAAKLS